MLLIQTMFLKLLISERKLCVQNKGILDMHHSDVTGLFCTLDEQLFKTLKWSLYSNGIRESLCSKMWPNARHTAWLSDKDSCRRPIVMQQLALHCLISSSARPSYSRPNTRATRGCAIGDDVLWELSGFAELAASAATTSGCCVSCGSPWIIFWLPSASCKVQNRFVRMYSGW